MTMSATRVELAHKSWSPFTTTPDWTSPTRVATLSLEQFHKLKLRDLEKAKPMDTVQLTEGD